MTQSEHEQRSGSLDRFLSIAGREAVVTLLPAVLLALFVNVFVAEAALVEEGPSMQPNLYIGYRVMTEKISYRFRLPRRGDIVVAEHPGSEKSLIKRVVGLPGEIVEVRGGRTFINRQLIREPWVTHWGGPDFPPTLVPPDHVFILGDNRANSRDSRSIGPVPLDAVRGHAWFVYWPPQQIRLLR
jgi:signal peptidase I